MSMLNEMIMACYPKSADCVNGHIGPTIKTWFEEVDDDRAYLLKVSRCGHCNMPNGPDDYANSDEQDAYYRGEQPRQSQEVNAENINR